MKRILLAALLLLPALAYSQVTLVNCAPSTPCNSSTGPSNTGSGDPAWKAFGEINGNFNLLPSQLFSGQPLPVVNGGNGTATPSLVGGTNVTVTGTWPNQTITASSTAATAFSALTSATNTSAAMLIGTGASLAPTGSGAITANAFNGVLGTANGGIGSTSLAGAAIPVFSGTITAGHCAEWLNATTLEDAGAACGTGGGGTGAFSSLTGGTNTTAAMLVGTGASFGPTGSGTVQANSLSAGIALGTPGSGNLVNASGLPLSSGVSGTLAAGNFPALTGDVTNSAGSLATTVAKVNGATVPASAAVLGSNSSSQLTALSIGANLCINSGVLGACQTINPQSGTSYAIATTDAGKLITFNNASAVAVTLSQATTAGFTSGFAFDVQNKGSGTVTITPTTSTVNGASTLAVAQNTGCTVTSDGTNYQVSSCSAVAPGASAAFSGLTSGTNTTATMTVGSGGTITVSGTGTINATQVNGAAVPASAALLASNSSSQATAVSAGAGLTISSATLAETRAVNAQVGTTYTVLSTDQAKLVTFSNASAVAVTLPQATGSFGAGFYFHVQNKGAGTATITPTTSTINDAATLAVATNTGCAITSDGTNYQVTACTALGGASATAMDAQTFTSSGTWTKPSGSPTTTEVTCIGAGGGGGGGAMTASGTQNSGGSGGGAGGIARAQFPTASLSSTVTVTIGAGTAGGTAATTAGAGGNASGSAGGASTFGALLSAGGGGSALGGASGTTSTGGGSGGALGNAFQQFGAPDGVGGAAGANGINVVSQFQSSSGGGGSTGSVGPTGGYAILAPTGGGAGGGVNATPTAQAGGNDGQNMFGAGAGGGAIQTVGSAGFSLPSSAHGGGGGGGGGGATTTTGTAGHGGNGTQGGGGGGGGSCNVGGTCGAGGTGGNGVCWVLTWF